VIRKGGDFEDNLAKSTRSINSRTIQYLTIAPYKIFIGILPKPNLLDLSK